MSQQSPSGNGTSYSGAEPAAAGESAPLGVPLASLPLASLRRRFGALVLDWILCLLVASFFDPQQHVATPSLVLVGEYGFFLGLFGQTLGMYLARIRCVPAATGAGVIGVPRAVLRGLLLALVIPGLIMDVNRRGLHDRAAGSVMVSAA